MLYAIATVFQPYYGEDMMYDNRGRKPEPTHLQTQRIFNLSQAWYERNEPLMML